MRTARVDLEAGCIALDDYEGLWRYAQAGILP